MVQIRFINWVCFLLSLVSAASLKGKLDVAPSNITGATLSRTNFKLHQIGNFSEVHGYDCNVKLKDAEGNFEFEDIPLNKGFNATTYFVLYSSSLDFNLKPNRILVEFTNLDDNGDSYVLKAYKNFFGKEYFPSPEIIYPEELESVATDPFITINLVNMAPFRMYYQQRNQGMFQNGPLAKLLDARWKQAIAITALSVVAFPFLVEKLDPETAKAIKEENQKKQRERYEIKQE